MHFNTIDHNYNKLNHLGQTQSERERETETVTETETEKEREKSIPKHVYNLVCLLIRRIGCKSNLRWTIDILLRLNVT